MLRIFSRIQIAYLCLFLGVCSFMFYYEAIHVWPAQQCEAQGGWWDGKGLVCATPIPIERITGHPSKAKAPLAATATAPKA